MLIGKILSRISNFFTFNEYSGIPERTKCLGKGGEEMRVNQARYPTDHVKRLDLFLSVQWGDLLASRRSTMSLPECATPWFIISLVHHLNQGVALLETLQKVKPHVRLICRALPPRERRSAREHLPTGERAFSLNGLHSQLIMASQHSSHFERRSTSCHEGKY